ncbi:MAG TPA: tetratricopeptide repeat protein, partial [Bacteroidetes bacterium]|nr:tetratricopeptide repeat protein [Bacteroidota bacterium]
VMANLRNKRRGCRRAASGFAAAFLAVVLLLLTSAAPLRAQEAVGDTLARLEPMGSLLGRDLIDRWRTLTTGIERTPEVESLINQGRLILFQVDALSEQVTAAELEQRGTVNLRIVRLRGAFKRILRALEIQRARNYPLDKLKQIRRKYASELNQVTTQIAQKRKDLIKKAEIFLNTYDQNPVIQRVANRDEIVAEVMFRLGDLYYQEEDEAYIDKFEQWSLEVAQLPPDAPEPPEPKRDFTRSINTFRRIIDEFPNTSYVADALYNIAVINTEQGTTSSRRQAKDTFRTLVSNFPESRYTPESLYRIGDFYFMLPQSDPESAIPFYEKVLEFPESEQYDDALYMLGWCYFTIGTQEAYEKAVEYFDATVMYTFDEREQTGGGAASFINLADEAIKYLAVSFSLDPEEWSGAGIDSAVAFLEADSLRLSRYGFDMMHTLGDLYRDEIGDEVSAVEAYERTIELYPTNELDPWLRENIIKLYQAEIGDLDSAYVERGRLFADYRRGTPWDKAHAGDTELRQATDTLLAKYYYTNFNIAVKNALDTDSKEAIDEALAVTQNYLIEFPFSEKTPRVQYNMAALLEKYPDNTQYLVNAYEAYEDVVTRWGENDYRENAAQRMVAIALSLVDREHQGEPIPDPTFALPEVKGGKVVAGRRMEVEEEAPQEGVKEEETAPETGEGAGAAGEGETGGEGGAEAGVEQPAGGEEQPVGGEEQPAEEQPAAEPEAVDTTGAGGCSS